jgi:nucleotide-binding universal stress UspA family protein
MMAKRILVPLDQSQLAEAVLPLVGEGARGGGGTVRLLHVAPVPDNRVDAEGRVIAWPAQEVTRLEAEGRDYLQTLELQLPGVPVECVVRFGDPVEEILLEAEVFGADLIVVSTAGRSGIARAVLGSVAQQVFGKAKTPVVLFRAGSTAR